MVYSSFNIEQQLWNSGFSQIAGVDEVGRGCFAGPVVVGAVIFPPNATLITGIADSKLLKAIKREELDILIKSQALCWAIAEVDVETINQIGIGKATQLAFAKVVKLLSKSPDFILIDAFWIEGIDKNIQKPIIHGDQICASISAAAIIAKVYRDQLMRDLHTKYPQYGFDQHKGYGTKAHQAMIRQHGLSEIHRRSFKLDKFL